MIDVFLVKSRCSRRNFRFSPSLRDILPPLTLKGKRNKVYYLLMMTKW